MRRFVALLLLPPLVGCFSYVDTGLPQLERGDRVRVYLSQPSSFDIGELVANNVVRLDAEVVRWTDDELVLSAWWLTAAGGREFAAEGRTVYVPRDRLDRIDRRQMNAVETGLASVGTVAAALLLGAVVLGGGGGEEGNGGGPPPTQ